MDIVFGHSSHHVRPLEVYHEKLILYGCGDFIDDYEGISGYEHYRDDLVLMFFPSVDPATGRLLSLRMTPLQIRKLRLNRASTEDSHWLCTTLNRITWTPNKDGTVRQLWEASTDQGKTWQVAFDGLYRRKST